MGSNFYVTLFSNSCIKNYPDNTFSAFAVQFSHEIDKGTNSWEDKLCDFSCPLPKVGNLKPHAVFYDTNALIYCDLLEGSLIKDIYSPYGILQ